MNLENWSDVSGLASGLALVVTAWRNDGLYGFVDKLRKSVEEAKQTAPTQDAMAGTIVTSLESELAKWSWIDRWSLRAGAGPARLVICAEDGAPVVQLLTGLPPVFRTVLNLAIELQLQYNWTMKTATIPPIRVAPEFRIEVEGVLEQGETLSEFVENAVRQTVLKRKNQAEFLRRGITAIEETKRAGGGIPAETVVAKLEAKLAVARRTQSTRN